MRNLLNFLINNIHIFLFLLLSGISIYFIYGSSSYRQWALSSFASEIGYPIYRMQNSVEEYFHLKSINQELVEQNRQLLNQIANVDISSENNMQSDTKPMYEYQSAKVISSSINLQNNLMILDKGSQDGISADMGVVSSQGIIGMVKGVSPHFSVVLSLLSSQFSVSVKTKRTEVVGVLTWNGQNYRYMQLGNLANIESVKIGDTIVTHYSLLFPPNYPIGVVSGGLKNKAVGGYYNLQVRLLPNFDNLNNVYIIKSNFASELDSLKKGDKDE